MVAAAAQFYNAPNLIYPHSGPAPAIPRLGIKPYQWGTECLSGDVTAGPATSFPQAIGMVLLLCHSVTKITVSAIASITTVASIGIATLVNII